MNIVESKSLLHANPTTELFVRRTALFLAMLLSGGNLALPRAPLIVGMVLCIFLVSNPATIFRQEFARIWALLTAILVIALIGADSLDPTGFAIRFANFFGALFLVAVYIDKPRLTLVRDAKPIFILFALQAVATPIAVTLFPNLITSFTVNNMTQYTLAFILFYHETIAGTGFMGLVRPNGFFFEPGVLQIYLNLFLYMALFHFRSLKLIGLAVVAVAATQSTTGLAISCALVGWAGFKYIRKLDASTTFVAAIFLPLAAFPIVWFTYRNVVEKLFGDLSTSTSAREFDLITGLSIIADHPLFGIGFSRERFREEFVTYGRQVSTILGDDALERSLSNGLVHLAVILGIPVTLVFVYAVFRQRFFGEAAVGGAIIILSMMTESLILTPFFCMIAFSGLLVARQYETKRRPSHGRPGARRRAALP